jgi:TonB family protein
VTCRFVLLFLAVCLPLVPARAGAQTPPVTPTPTPPLPTPPLPSPTPPAGTLSKAPKLIRFVEAEPPPALTTRGSAEVVLTIDVDATGKVQSVTVAKPAGDGFDEAALAAARQFEFAPGEAGGKPVPVRITYKYQFLYKAPPAPPAPAAPEIPSVPFSGVVKSKGERTPLAGVTLVIDDDLLSATTDTDGAFRFDKVPVGKHKVKLRGPGITPAENPLTLKEGKALEVTYYAAAKTRYTSVVRGQRAVEETVEHTLSGEEVRRIPGTQGDTLKAVQNLPGVARAPFGGGLLVVWGSSPFDTRTYVDGVFIPTSFHFFGLRSTVNSEMVQGVRFMPGGYGADYGRGMGGVIEVESRKPRDDGYHGFVQIDALDASLMFTAGLPKKLSLAVAVRRSTMDAWLPFITPNDFQLTPTYYDYQAKLHWKATPKDDLELFFFGSDDVIKLVARRPDPALSGAFDSHIFYHRVLAKYTHRFGRATLTITPSIGYDVPFQLSGAFGNTAISVDAKTFEYSVRAVARIPIGTQLRLDAGIDFEGNKYDISATAPVTGPPREGDPGGFGGAGAGFITTRIDLNTNHLAPYVSAEFQLFNKRLMISPQLRLDMYTFNGYQGSPDAFSSVHVNIEPRLSLRYRFTKWVALKAAIGVYHQPPDPIAFMRGFGNPKLVPQFALHYVLGVDFQPTPTLQIQMQGFYKDLRSLVVRGEKFTDPVLVNDGIGRVYGGELLVRQEFFKNFFGWVAYTLSRSERIDHSGQPWRIFQYDQTHILTLVASYKLPRGFQIGLRFRYVTGNPQTPVLGGYYDANAGVYRRILGPTYSGRATDFHQLDARFDKTFTFNRWKLSIYVDIQNVYNYQSAEGQRYNFDFTQTQAVAGLPVVPSLGIRGEF